MLWTHFQKRQLAVLIMFFDHLGLPGTRRAWWAAFCMTCCDWNNRTTPTRVTASLFWFRQVPAPLGYPESPSAANDPRCPDAETSTGIPRAGVVASAEGQPPELVVGSVPAPLSTAVVLPSLPVVHTSGAWGHKCQTLSSRQFWPTHWICLSFLLAVDLSCAGWTKSWRSNCYCFIRLRSLKTEAHACHDCLAEITRRRCRCSGTCSSRKSAQATRSWSCSATFVRSQADRSKAAFLKPAKKSSRWISLSCCLDFGAHLTEWSCRVLLPFGCVVRLGGLDTGLSGSEPGACRSWLVCSVLLCN